ncbi:helix-turn-helix domain-containing protein [Butyrivibrio sp. AE3004]|uniref:helix-turn-helix domain-containing protein n=1 Tax=Butyrivibrio sp. AE3004 TaxID=1506994 RepID=UPI0009DDEBD9|nr:helix-turn-helix transcriptional regulator [Butyrivibrio sp. AE3004]
MMQGLWLSGHHPSNLNIVKTNAEVVAPVSGKTIIILGKNICQYIDNNYFDVNMNLNTIAEHFDITPAYLSKKFKNEYGKSVIDYLYEIRINHAIQKLQNTNMKISDIAAITGFSSSNAFIRIFKKMKGTTPGKYN